VPRITKIKPLDRAYRFLSFRPRSEKEIKNYLKRKKVPDEAIQKVVDELKRQKLVDDLEFARWWIEQRQTFRPKGKIALQMELGQKGVDREVTQGVIDEMVDELALAKKAFQKKKVAYEKLSQREFRQKMSAFLARRGFSWSTIKETLDELGKK